MESDFYNVLNKQTAQLPGRENVKVFCFHTQKNI